MELTNNDKAILVQVLLRAITEQSLVSDIDEHYNIIELEKDMAVVSQQFNKLIDSVDGDAGEMEKLNILLLKKIAKDMIDSE